MVAIKREGQKYRRELEAVVVEVEAVMGIRNSDFPVKLTQPQCLLLALHCFHFEGCFGENTGAFLCLGKET